MQLNGPENMVAPQLPMKYRKLKLTINDFWPMWLVWTEVEEKMHKEMLTKLPGQELEE